MTESGAAALQLCPFETALEAGLAARFEVIRWFELSDADRASWLDAHAASVRVIATSGNVGCSNALIEVLPRLGIIAINGVGFDKVDLAFAQSRGVRVTTTPGVLTDDVADLAVGLVIGLLRRIPNADQYVRGGAWPGGNRPLARKVSGRRFGIVGLGHIGLAIAVRLAPFGAIAYTSTTPKSVPYRFYPDVIELARASDVLVLACAANASTRHMIDARVIDALGQDGYLVNIARGSVVDEAALIAALNAGRLAGAALDVFENEPHVPDALRANSETVLTPHIGSATVETRQNMAELVLENLDAFLAGLPLPSAISAM
jgi:lactate dehydrogenase-like 2-hydroxyacid dehydrogenase